MSEKRKQVVIVGGGFGGLNAAKILGSNDDYDVTLIDRRNHHLFQPLLYQVAMAALSPAEIATPIRSAVRQFHNVEVLMDEVKNVDPVTQEVVTKRCRIPYDYLIMACGANHSYFGNNNWEEYAPGLKTLPQATEIRRRVLTAFEQAEAETNVEKQRQLLTFVVVGGGPTGVELSGSIAEISRQCLRREFRKLDTSTARVILLEGGPAILRSYGQRLSRKAAKALERLGVQVWTNSMVTQINENGVEVGGDEFIKASTVLWAAGVAPSPINKETGFELGPNGRIAVDQYCRVAEMDNVFVIGDQAYFKDNTGVGLPGLAPVAVQQGRFVAKHLTRLAKGAELKPFKYFDKGQMATIGRNNAVLKAFGIELSGFFAWLSWLLVHIMYLIGFRNRLAVMLQWVWAYLTFRKGARLIVGKEWKTHSQTPVRSS